MKKIFTIVAVLSAGVYLAAGIGLLVFQNMFKGLYLGNSTDWINVYPVQNVLQLVFLGIPCLVLGIVAVSEYAEGKKGVDLLLVIYSSVMLVGFGLIASLGGMMNNVWVGRMNGVTALANISAVNSMFGFIEFLSDLSLVMLLLRGAISLGENKNR